MTPVVDTSKIERVNMTNDLQDRLKVWTERKEYSLDRFRQGNLTDEEIVSNAHDLALADDELYYITWDIELLKDKYND